MDFQIAFNIAIGIIGVIGGWMLNNLRDSFRDLAQADVALTGKVQAIEVLVAGNYMTTANHARDYDKLSIAIFNKLDRIESKIDMKADK